MPSPVIHVAAGCGLFMGIRRCVNPERLQKYFGTAWTLLFLCVFFSMLPDIDAAIGMLCRNMRDYHNQGTHSLLIACFTALIAGMTAETLRRGTGRAWSILVVTGYAVHVMLDYCCFGRGVMLFWPVSTQRYQSPIVLFSGVRWSDGFLSWQHVRTFFSELGVVACVAFSTWLIGRLHRLIKH